MTSFLVTISAILQYLAKAKQAKEQLDQATNEMKRAATDLCSKWQGDAATAFAAEQEVLCTWCNELSNVGAEYMSTLEKVSRAYEEAEQAVTSAIQG